MKLVSIEQGNHYSSEKGLSLLFRIKSNNSFVFLKNCEYNIGTAQDQINKLTDLALGYNHHYASARIGWSYNIDTKVIDLFSYCYVNGNRVSEYITSVEFDEEFEVSIELKCDHWHIIVRKKEGVFVKNINLEKRFNLYYCTLSWFGYRLNPYFGGKVPAPHKMNILFL